MSSFIVVDGWRVGIRFSSAHIIPEYEKCGRLHGHTYAVHLKIFGVPDSKGIIMDFSQVKDVLKDIVNNLDHRVLIPEKSKSIDIKKEDDSVFVDLLGKRYCFPVCDCLMLPISSTSAENLAFYILDVFCKEISFPSDVSGVEVGVDEGFGQGARVFRKL